MPVVRLAADQYPIPDAPSQERGSRPARFCPVGAWNVWNRIDFLARLPRGIGSACAGDRSRSVLDLSNIVCNSGIGPMHLVLFSNLRDLMQQSTTKSSAM